MLPHLAFHLGLPPTSEAEEQRLLDIVSLRHDIDCIDLSTLSAMLLGLRTYSHSAKVSAQTRFSGQNRPSSEDYSHSSTLATYVKIFSFDRFLQAKSFLHRKFLLMI
jgi:hypothetical protein